MRATITMLGAVLLIAGCGDDGGPTAPAADGDAVALGRTDFSWASRPVDAGSGQKLEASSRVGTLRWFAPPERVPARWLDPALAGAAGDATVPALELFLRSDRDDWLSADWGGVMRGFGPDGRDCLGIAALEIWVNDGRQEPGQRRGRLHLDLGRMDEDGFWPDDRSGQQVLGAWEREDGCCGSVPDGVFVPEEDIGLDLGGCDGPQRYDPEFNSWDDPYPQINGTACNLRADTEDIDGDTVLNRDDAYTTFTIDLRATPAEVDVVCDYDNPGDLPPDAAWRRYRIPLAAFAPPAGVPLPDWSAVPHLRLWYDDPAGSPEPVVRLQIAHLRLVPTALD